MIVSRIKKLSLVLSLAALLVPVASLHAQRLAGTVRDSASAAPLPGAVVMLLDDAGAQLARTLSDGNGRWSIQRTPAAGHVRVIRIGFIPRVVDLPAIASSVDVVMTRIPPLLAPMEVSSRALCSYGPDRRRAAALWDQARAGLLASVVAREANAATTQILTYTRTTAPSDEHVVQQTTHIASGRTTRPFLTIDPPAQLMARGFIEEDSLGRIYKAPDADVLLDDSFAETHCFDVKPEDLDHPGALGLAFEPAQGRDSLVDVRGVLWMDLGVPALRSLEFRFTQLEPAAMRAGAGGSLQFHAMANGVVFVEQWEMNLPILKEQQLTNPARVDQIARGQDAAGHDRRISQVLNRSVVQMSETGGVVLSAVWSDSLVFHAALPVMTGHVWVDRTNVPLPGVIVTLAGTTDTARTDADGRFVFPSLIAGRYIVTATDTAFASFSTARQVSTTAAVSAGRSPDVLFGLPSRNLAMSRMCDGQRIPDNTTIMFGTLVADALFDYHGLSLGANWQRQFSTTGKPGNDVVTAADTYVDVSLTGRFRVCAVPALRSVTLTLRRDGRPIADTVVVASRGNLAFSVQWPLLHNTDANAPRATARAPRTTAFSNAVLTGVIRRATDKEPLKGVDVWLPTLDRHALSDSTGHFRLERLPAGRVPVQVRQPGYAAARDSVTLIASGTSYRDFLMTSVPPSAPQ